MWRGVDAESLLIAMEAYFKARWACLELPTSATWRGTLGAPVREVGLRPRDRGHRLRGDCATAWKLRET